MPQADAVDVTDNEVLDETLPEGDEDGEQPDDTGEDPAQTEGDESETDEVQVQIGDEPATADEDDEQAGSTQFRKIRQRNRDLTRENRDLKQQLTAQAPADPVVKLGPKPTLESAGYDTDQFETDLTAWFARKREADDRAEKDRKKAEDANNAWVATRRNYEKLKSDLKVRDFDDAEAVVIDTLSVAQQGLILQGAENPALVVCAIGKNPATAKKLAGIEDPVKFAFAVAKLETKLKVTPRTSAPHPERVVRGNASAAGGVDKTLEGLEAKAARTGDRTAVIRYKRQQEEKRTG